MNRRDSVLAVLAFGAGAGSLAAETKQAANMARVMVLAGGSPEGTGYLIDAFKRGLNELGYVEGKNVVFAYRYAFGRMERLPDLAKELVALKPDVIFTTYTGAALAVRQLTTTIPIVFGTGDPIASGLVKSLARPGGNVTGLSGINVDVSPKLLELLLTAEPKLSRVAHLGNPANPIFAATLRDIQTAALVAGVSLSLVEAQNPAEIDSAFGRLNQESVKAIIVQGDPLFILQRRQIAELASTNRMLSAFSYREHVEAGGLVSYGENLLERFRFAATYVDKILKGANPGDLPIEQATRFELVINLKTAKALGLAIPQSLLLRADEVIQ